MILSFSSYFPGNIAEIVDLMLDELSRRIADYDLQLEVTPEAKELLAEEGFDPPMVPAR